MPQTTVKSHQRVLTIIVLAQFCCTSLWFASNAVMDGLVADFGLSEAGVGHLTSAVQLGFILGTLVFAILSIADRFSPSRVFLVCGIAGALTNAMLIWSGHTMSTLVIARMLTGFFLAGIYPIGMKIASDYFDQGLGRSLGYLVGALVLGTALPHLLRGWSVGLPWRLVIFTTSGVAALGALAVGQGVTDGPYRRASAAFQPSAFLAVFRDRDFRSAALGYFGHMWELYAFWTFVPSILFIAMGRDDTGSFISFASFGIIGVGALACVLGGYWSLRVGPAQVARTALTISLLCCLLSPFIGALPIAILLIFMLIWGVFVIMDSPMFSTLVAQRAPSAAKGTALTIVNCIGFAITIVSIQLIQFLLPSWGMNSFVILAIGPVIGLWAMRRS